jgi:twitching motility protein PilT
MELHEMLRKMVIERSSDLFIKAGSPPALRIDGAVNFLDTEEITPQDTLEIYEIIEDSKREGFHGKTDIDVAYELPGIGRFRVNIFRQRGTTAFVFRHIQSNIPKFETLNLPEKILKKLAQESRGLLLITGTTGSGKSTTMAAMINYINENFNRHILTIEDPIEFMFKDKRSVVDQREIGIDTPDFITALKHAVRQSPDIILIGEMRDRETMEVALSAAETGHLVVSTLHTVNATQTIERIINYFPPHQHNLIRLQLSLTLKGVVSQRGEYFGCQTFNQALKGLYQNDFISLESALAASDYPEELKLDLKGIFKGAGAMSTDFNFEY